MKTAKLLLILSIAINLPFLTANADVAREPGQLNDSLPLVLPRKHADQLFLNLRKQAESLHDAHKLPTDLKAWEAYRIKLRNKIIAKAGIKINHKLPLELEETGSVQMKGYQIKKIVFQTQPKVYATANLYVPDGKGKFPGVVVMLGHSSEGKMYDKYQAVSATLATNGYVALCIDPFGAGERTTKHGVYDYHGGNMGASMMNIGESLLGFEASDNIRAVDLLCALPYVDANKIGATGSSGGGNQTMWLTAIDERVKASVPVVSVGTFEAYVMRTNCFCELLVDGLSFTEEAGVLSLIAPRAVMPCNHLQDGKSFHPTEMMRTYTDAKPIFGLYKLPQNINYSIFDLKHGYWPEDRRAMLGWLDLHLKNIGNGTPKAELPYDIFSADDLNKLMVFEKGKRNPKVEGLPTYCSRKGKELRIAMLEKKSFNAMQKVTELKSVLKVDKIPSIKTVTTLSKQEDYQRVKLETSDNKTIPLLYIPASKPALGYVILSNVKGKDSIDRKLIDSLKAAGSGIVLADLSGTGEMASPVDQSGSIGRFFNRSRSEIWLGKTTMGQWVEELGVVAEYLISSQHAQKISIDASKEAGLAGLFLAAINKKVDQVTLRDAPISYAFDNIDHIDFMVFDAYSTGIHIPGFLKWGDVSLATALSGKNIAFIKPMTMSGRIVSGKELAAYKSEFEKMRKICHEPGKTTFN